MIKVAFLQKTNVYSGAENVVITIMKLLPKDEYDCYYVSPDGPIRKFVEEAELNFYPIKNAKFKTIKKTMLALKPDIIHATDYRMSSYAGFLNLDIPVVAHLHNNVPWIKNPLHPNSILFALALPKIKSVICVSESIENEFVYRNLMKNKIHVIYNVVDLKRVQKLSNEDVQLKEEFDVGYLGRLTPQKKPLLYCELIKELKASHNNIKAMMVGEGELHQEIEDYIKENNLENNIKLMGFQPNPYKYIKNAKILLMPSSYEGYGLAAVESLCLGLPVVCSGAGGLKDIVDDNSGKICHSSDEYVTEIQKLLEDKEYYANKSMGAIEAANRFGDLEEYKNKIISVYKESLD